MFLCTKLHVPILLVGLRNLSCRTVTLKKGTVVAKLSATNMMPQMLAPKLAKSQLELSSKNDKLSGKVELEQVINSPLILTPERRKALFCKLNLAGYDNWPVEQQTAMDEVIERYHHICC